MIQKILVGVDTSPTSAYVFTEALMLAQGLKASLVLLHVLSEEAVPPGVGYYPHLSEDLFQIYRSHWAIVEKQSQDFLTSLTYEASVIGVEAEYFQRSGSPGRMICELATQVQADLIVMGRRGFSGLTEFLTGSESNFVMHNAPCSVLVVQGSKVKSQVPETVAANPV